VNHQKESSATPTKSDAAQENHQPGSIVEASAVLDNRIELTGVLAMANPGKLVNSATGQVVTDGEFEAMLTSGSGDLDQIVSTGGESVGDLAARLGFKASPGGLNDDSSAFCRWLDSLASEYRHQIAGELEQRRPAAEVRYRAALDEYYGMTRHRKLVAELKAELTEWCEESGEALSSEAFEAQLQQDVADEYVCRRQEPPSYSGDNPPSYKAPGSEEWNVSVQALMHEEFEPPTLAEWAAGQPLQESAREWLLANATADDEPVWPEMPWNQEGSAQRALLLAEGKLRWLKDEKTWIEYQGVRWVRDEDAGPRTVQAAMKAARTLEAGHYSDERQKDDKGKEKPGSSPREKFIKSLSDASTMPVFRSTAQAVALSGDVTSTADDFDRDPFLLGVGNGVLDLRTGKLVDAAADQMVSKGTDVCFDPEAKAPLFEAYLRSSMPDVAQREYLQAVMGYSVTGSTIEQAFFIHWGETNNGKSVLFNVTRPLLGEHMGSASSKALIRSKGDKHTVELADLAGPRLLQMSETEEGAHLEEATIKQITGGDMIAARKIAQSNQEWRITGKIHILTNELPHISPTPSNRRRLHLVKWPVEIKRPDLDLEAKIRASELPGVLNWLVAGVQLWLANLEQTKAAGEGRPTGLIRPHMAAADLDEYLHDEDELAQWLLERTDAAEEPVTKASVAYQSYETWKWTRGGKALTQTAFGKKLKEKKIGWASKRDGNYYALTLRASNEGESQTVEDWLTR
jgi:P4 family phage/plasmid primase-like protien